MVEVEREREREREGGRERLLNAFRTGTEGDSWAESNADHSTLMNHTETLHRTKTHQTGCRLHLKITLVFLLIYYLLL